MRSIVPSPASEAGGGSLGSLTVFGTSLGYRLGMTLRHSLETGERDGVLTLVGLLPMIPVMNRVNRVYLVRHGQVVGYENFPVYGHTDVDLTQVGRLQTEYLAERLRLAHIRTIYCSDLKRSAIGAQIIARYHDVPIHVLPEFREVYFGDWEGLSLQEIHEQFPGELEKRKEALINFRAPGNGESVAHLSERIMACYRRILEQQKGHDFLIVGHGAVNRVILCEALGLDLARMFSLHQDYGCLNIIDYFSDSTLVRLING